jgi:serine/threonine protein kinase
MSLSDRALERLQKGFGEPELEDTRYRLLRELGQGGMAKVYLAEDTRLGREVAIKVLQPALESNEAAERLLREARIIAGLEHPGIVPVHDAGTLPDGRVFYAMKRVAGVGLNDFRQGKTQAEILRTFLRITEPVAFAHAHGVIHRDLKPENVMIGSFGEVLVMDWGVAKVLQEPDSPPLLVTAKTQDGAAAGTPAYMAPEQRRGDRDLDPRADVFALGVMLSELLGDAPPAPLRSMIQKACATDRHGRYGDAAELGADIARFLNNDRVTAHRETALERAARFFHRYQAAILLIAAYLIMRAVLFFFLKR